MFVLPGWLLKAFLKSVVTKKASYVHLRLDSDTPAAETIVFIVFILALVPLPARKNSKIPRNNSYILGGNAHKKTVEISWF